MSEQAIDLFEGVDLKNLKAEVVPAGVIYPAILKCLGLFLCGLYNVILVFTISAYGLKASHGIKDWSLIMLCNLFCTGLAAIVPTVLLWTAVFRYQMFKRSIAIHLKHGQVICQLLEKAFYIMIASYFGLLLLIFAVYQPFSFEETVSTSGSSNILFVILAFGANWILHMEIARRGIKLGVNTINELLGKVTKG